MDPLEPLDALAAAAVRRETACGRGALVWRAWGPPDGHPVLLLHGGSGSWTHWLRNIAPLAQAGRRVIAPDLPGFGESATPPDGNDADALPAWLELGMRSIVGDAAVDVVGFSFGALVAGLWAQAAPHRFARLVLVGSPGLSNEVLRPLDLRRWNAWPAGPERDAVHRHNLLQLMLADAASADALAVALHAPNVVRDRMRKRRLMLTDALVPILPTLQCPLGGIWGAQDVLYRGRLELVGRVLALAPRFESLTLLPDAGHWVQFESAAAFNAALSRMLGLDALAGA